MKNLILICGCLLTVTILTAQKVQVKKGKILLDKVATFEMVKTKKGGMVDLNAYALRDLEGNDILIFKDNIINYTPLPSELNPRPAVQAFTVTAPNVNKSMSIPYHGIGFVKTAVNTLEAIGFFKSKTMDEKMYDAYIEKQFLDKHLLKIEAATAANEVRLKNYELSLERYGFFAQRKFFRVQMEGEIIKDGTFAVGRFNYEKVITKVIKTVKNNKDQDIASFIMNLDEKKCSVKTKIDGLNKKFFVSNSGAPSAANVTSNLYKQMAEYLVNYGYL